MHFLILDSFNRTIVELKSEEALQTAWQPKSFNRTIVELKCLEWETLLNEYYSLLIVP